MSGPLRDIFAGWRAARGRHSRVGSNVFELDLTGLYGARVDLGPGFRELLQKYGRPGVIRGWDHSVAYQEVRQFDFSNWPRDMYANDRKKMKKLIHTPQWVMISAAGMKAALPTTGKWVRRGEKGFDRLSRLPVVGTVNENQGA